jgi:hypothetical protein
MQAAILHAECFATEMVSSILALLVPNQMQTRKKVALSKLRDRPFRPQSYYVRKELKSVFLFIPQGNLIYKP